MLIIYLGLLAIATLEAFTPTAYLVPGTLGVVAAGGFVQAGRLNAGITFLVVFIGVLIGDTASYLLARKFGNLIRRWKSVADALGRAEARLQRHPVAFILLSHFSPFLKNLSAPAAGLVGWSWRRFLPLEIVASLLDAFWFLALGFVVSASVGGVTQMPVAARIVGAVALLATAGFLIGRGRKCTIPRKSRQAPRKARRGFAFFIKCLVLLGPWELLGRLAKTAGVYDRTDYRAALAKAVEAAKPGDVILVGRTMAAPWGQYSHAMMTVETPIGKALIHAYETSVQLTSIRTAPMTGKVAVARIECSSAQREAMVNAVWSQLGTPFKLGSLKPDNSPTALNCIGLISWAATRAGIALLDVPAGVVVVPDDILTATNVKIIFEWQESDDQEVQPPSASQSPHAHIGGVAALPVDGPRAVPTAEAVKMIRSELFLGMSRKDGQPIAASEVSAFFDEEVVSRFPAGTTLVSANGTYGSRTTGIIHEQSLLLTILHSSELASWTKIQELAEIYKTRFQQEAVMIAMSPALVFGAS